MIPPKGKDFLHYIEHILEREKNWVSVIHFVFLSLYFIGAAPVMLYSLCLTSIILDLVET